MTSVTTAVVLTVMFCGNLHTNDFECKNGGQRHEVSVYVLTQECERDDNLKIFPPCGPSTLIEIRRDSKVLLSVPNNGILSDDELKWLLYAVTGEPK